MGNAYKKLKKYKQATKCHDKLLEIDPNYKDFLEKNEK